jgi:hypothetical protein
VKARAHDVLPHLLPASMCMLPSCSLANGARFRSPESACMTHEGLSSFRLQLCMSCVIIHSPMRACQAPAHGI